MAKKISFKIRSASNIAGWVLVGGAVSTVVYKSLGLRCPMQSVGLACPGCGCGRAFVAVLTDGPIEAFQLQPSALLFLFSLTILAVIGRLTWVADKNALSNVVVSLPLALGFGNLVFQLMRAGSI